MTPQSESHHGRQAAVLLFLLVALGVLGALGLFFGLTSSASSASAEKPVEALSTRLVLRSDAIAHDRLTTAAPEASVTPPPPTPTPTPDCSKPPGQHVKLYAEDEIVVAARSKSNKMLENVLMDSSGQLLNTILPTFYSSYDALSDVRWPAIAMGDINGDDKDEMLIVLRDKQKRVSVVTSAGGAPWYRDASDVVGDNVQWLDIAAGNLDRSGPDDEVVVAFADNDDDITLWALNGDANGNIAQQPNNVIGWYWDDQAGRGNVRYTALDTGDLDGDGFDDEIVTAFQDGNDDLQVLILQRNSTELSLLWSKAWTNHDRGNTADDENGYANERPIDVTTGDVDGDHRDEVIVGFRDGNYQDDHFGLMQLLVLDYNESAGQVTVDDRVFVQRDVDSQVCGSNSHCYRAPTSISVSAADLDGDGIDEIAIGYNAVIVDSVGAPGWQQFLMSYEYVPVGSVAWQGCSDDDGKMRPCLQERAAHWSSTWEVIPAFVSEVNPEALVVIATGDVDLDGKAEIALIHQVHQATSGQPQYTYVRAFDADSSLTERDWEAIYWTNSDKLEEFWVAMGDQNGDSWYGDYTGICYYKDEAQVTTVIQSPPFWEENDDQAEAAFGEKVTTGGGTGQTTESTVGGSVTLGVEAKGIDRFFTREWETSASVEHLAITTTIEGDGISTCPPEICADTPYWDAIGVLETTYLCYDYTESHLGIMNVCLPQEDKFAKTAYSLDTWYAQGITDYPSSWIPVGLNLAQGRLATQSSTYSSGAAGKAVDGNTDGNYYDGSVAHTGNELYAWWQVDLGGVQWVDAVQVWNRTDNACGARVKNFYVFLSDDPFASNDPNTLAHDPNVWNFYVAGQCGSPTTVPVVHHGRYVRAQLTDQNYLNIAEVQVWGRPGAPNLWPVSRPVTTTGEAFQLVWTDPNQRSGQLVQPVAGEILYTHSAAALIGVRPNSTLAEFDLGQASEGEQVTTSSSETSSEVGLEIRGTGGEGTQSTTEETSYVVSWSKEVEFSGNVTGIGLPSDAYKYDYMPYVWLQQARSSGGTHHAFMVLDYWVPSIGQDAGMNAVAPVERPRSSLVVTPAMPLVGSPTHADPAAWVITNTAVFTWTQPPADPAVIAGYRWYLDQVLDTVPRGVDWGLTATDTYRELRDGVWYFHVRAKSDGGQWSTTAHRAIRVDTTPPFVRLVVDPPQPTGNNGWYVTPVTVTVSAADTAGSGVAGIEISADGVTWQPYPAPLHFTEDTPGTIVYARAGDAAGLVSAPISTTFKIDRTPPDSHIVGGQGPGAWVATVITDTLGNRQLVLAGAIADGLSGRAGLNLQYDGLDWTTANRVGSWHSEPDRPQVDVNWTFTATHELGAGNHIFVGRAQDEAGNLEDPYEIARVLWFPRASPDIAGSSLIASPATIRPGEVVTFTLVARNGGWQEAHVAMVSTLPTGLTPVTATLDSSVVYDPTARTLTWPARLLWPGQWIRRGFQAKAALGLPAAALQNSATLHAFWPNTDLLPPAERQLFLNHEQTTTVTAAVIVRPNLPSGVDVTPPWVSLVRLSDSVLNGAQVRLGILAAPDARWMFLREWKPDPATGAWTVAQSSGWVDYIPTTTWTLSPGQGVRYLGVWVADRARNLSTLDEAALVFVNRIDGSQALASGQRVQYRGDAQRGAWVIATLTTVSGDPDLYIWRPQNGFLPDLYSEDTVLPGQVENVGGQLTQPGGLVLVEVQAVSASEYELSLVGTRQPLTVGSHLPTIKARPRHPWVISDPLSAGQTGAIVTLRPKIYFPAMFRSD